MDKRIISASLALSMLLVGCGTEDSAKTEWEISQNIDKGNYDAAIAALGDCSTKTGQAQTDCYTNLGAAYFGKSGFDIVTLGQDLLGIDSNLSDDAKDEKFNEIIFEKLLNENTKLGTDAFEKVLGTNESNCTEASIDTLAKSEKNACLSISPILLKDSLEDEDSNNTKSTNTATLSDVIEFTDVMKDAAPEIDAKDLVTVVNDKTPDNSKDLNSNGELDIVEATRCILDAYNANPVNVNTCTGVTISAKTDDVFGTTGTYANIDSVTATIGAKKFYRLIKEVDTDNNNVVDTYTSITVDSTKKVTYNSGDNTLNETENDVDGTTVFYKPVISNNSVGTLNDSIVSTLNDPNKLKTIALLTSGEDDNKTDTQKVSDFQKEICGANTTTLPTNGAYGNCTVTNGTLNISQDAVLKYMNKN